MKEEKKGKVFKMKNFVLVVVTALVTVVVVLFGQNMTKQIENERELDAKRARVAQIEGNDYVFNMDAEMEINSIERAK